MRKRFLFIVPFAALLLLQLWRPALPVAEEDPAQTFYTQVDAPAPIREILERSCADCHSVRTEWPWYTRITPVGQWLVHHVDEGSRHFSLSNYGEYPRRRQRKIFHELAHEVESGHMPLASYLWMHREATLEESERLLLVNWANGMAAAMEEPSGEPSED